jgi:tRNA(adenine34) deaminase
MNHHFFMKKALEQAEKALVAGEFPVGCIVAMQNRILVASSRTGTKAGSTNEIDHAELVALRRLTQLEKNTNTKTILYCTLEPCLMCFGAIILSGIDEVVYAYEDVMGGGTQCNLRQLSPLYTRTRISIVPNILRRESLKLFKTYFSNPASHYWQGSLLAKYTLSQ